MLQVNIQKILLTGSTFVYLVGLTQSGRSFVFSMKAIKSMLPNRTGSMSSG
jgi:hypothetical protein